MAPKTREEMTLNDMVTRLDERSVAIQDQINSLNDLLKTFEKKIEKQEEKYVRKEQFVPVQKAVYALISLIVMTVISVMIGQVLVKPMLLPIGH